ncbi:MAG: cation:proton antiporter [Magnetospirillum sp. WYHS-4]
MSHSPLYLDILILLMAAVVIVPVAKRLGIPSVIAYLAAGVALGPYTPGPVIISTQTQPLAEFGVVFLLFAIGLELPITRLRSMRHYILGLGVLQVLWTGAAIGGIALALGRSSAAALTIGAVLAFSSTAAVLTMLVERNETVTRFGRAAVAVLILQDLAVVPVLTLLPLLKGDSGSIASALGLASVKAGAAMAVIFLAGRFVIGPAYRFISAAGNPEVFTATNLLLILAVGWATAEAGMSMALGAFLAGLLLSDTAYRHQVEADIAPFRGLLLGLFFMTVGMAIDLPLVGERLGAVLGLTLGLLALKATILFALAMAFRLSLPAALRVGLLLAQGGEFAFVLLKPATELGVVEPADSQILLAVVALSMAATPLLAFLGRFAAEKLERRWGQERFALQTSDLRRHVIIAGYGRVGRTVARLLAASQIPYVALETDPHRVADARRAGLPVFFGDAAQPAVLRAAGVERAQAVVITLNRPRHAEAAVSSVRHAATDVMILARAHDSRQREILLKAGATRVIPETIEASLQLAGLALQEAGLDPVEIERSLDDFRRAYYSPPHA